MDDAVSLNVYVQRLMRERGISHEPPVPLYRWWLATEEHEELRRLIDEKLEFGTPWAAADCIGFVAFASREFARQYESGPWTWDVIFQRLKNRPALGDCYTFVEKGFRWLGLRVHHLGGRRQYLFGLVVEGGLPLGLVKRRGTHLHRYLRRVLEDCERFKRSDPRLLAARLGTDLPLSLQRDEVYALTGELVSRIIALRTMVATAEDPVGELDRTRPGWRRLVPLPVEDDVAEALLRGLLTAPKVEARAGARIALEPVLRGLEQFSLSRRVVIPSLIGTDSLNELLGSDTGLPSRFRLYAASESGLRIPLASLTRQPRGDEFEVRRLESETALRELPWHSRVQLVASDGANHLATAPLAGGDPLSDLPMVFAETDEAGSYRFIKSGRTFIPADECHVLAFGDTRFAPDADSDAERIGYTEAPEAQVYRVRGRVRVDFPSGSCSIRTRENATDEGEYVLRGATRQLGPRGADVFLGLPRVEQVLPNGPRIEVSPDDIQWRPARLATAAWRSGRVAAFGDVVMRVQHHGETAFSTRATVFPPDFGFQMHVGVGEGTIVMSGLDAEDLAVEGSFQHKPSCQPSPGGGWTMHFGGEMPESGVCEVHVRFRAGRSQVSATVPVASRRFVTASGRALRPRQRVTVDDLPGIWAEVLSPDDLAEWDLEVWGGGRPTIEGRLPRDASGVHRLPLDGLEDLARARLSMLPGIDDTVDMRLERASFPAGAPHTEIAIGRYNSEFKRLEHSDSGWTALLAPSSVLAGDASRMERLSVEAHRLWAPQLDPVVASMAGPGTWVFDGALEEGMWIVLGRLGATCAVRPQLLVSGRPWERMWPCEFASAVSARREDLDARLEALLIELERDALHLAWEPFLEAMASAIWLPVTTHRCVVLATRRPRLMAMCAMRMALRPSFPSFWSSVEDLPFAWCLIGVDDWADAADDIAASLCPAEGIPSDVREGVTLSGMATVMEAIRKRYIAFSTIQELMAHEGLPVPRLQDEAPPSAEALPRRQALRRMTIESDRRRLHRFHHHGWWPQAHMIGFPRRLEETADVPTDVWITSPSSWQDDIANAPVVAAAICAGSRRPALKLIGELKRLRTFDAEWFEEAHAATLATLLDPRLASKE